MNCHCCSGKDFQSCCEPYLSNVKNPPSAQELMRSRYSAYVVANIDYLEQTQVLTEEKFDKKAALKWSKESKWKGLDILSTKQGLEGDTEGVVEFVAHYDDHDGSHSHHEVSHFVFKDKWLFDSSITPEKNPIKREGVKVGRNDPCPCGSGKKFKKCCA